MFGILETLLDQQVDVVKASWVLCLKPRWRNRSAVLPLIVDPPPPEWECKTRDNLLCDMATGRLTYFRGLFTQHVVHT